MQDLPGKVAIITGGASGIGLALAKRFAAEGMHLALVDIESEALLAAASDLRTTGVDVFTRSFDVSQGEAMERFAKEAIGHFGQVHVVCNNAGVATAGPIWELSEADWEFTLGPNLWGVIHGMRAFAPHLIANNEGHFVNTASMAGLVSMPNMGAYNVTKQGVVALSETLFEDLRAAESEVGVSVLCPAFVQTRIWDSERNRPERLRNESEVTNEKTEAITAGLRGIIESSMPTEQVASAVVDAILANKLYILTHDFTKPLLRKRIDHILDDENPTPVGVDAVTQNAKAKKV